MTPHDKFEKSVHVLERSFDYIHQNVFKDRWQLSLGFMINLFLLLTGIYSLYYTTSAYYDPYTVTNAICLLLGYVHV